MSNFRFLNENFSKIKTLRLIYQIITKSIIKIDTPRERNDDTTVKFYKFPYIRGLSEIQLAFDPLNRVLP